MLSNEMMIIQLNIQVLCLVLYVIYTRQICVFARISTPQADTWGVFSKLMPYAFNPIHPHVLAYGVVVIFILYLKIQNEVLSIVG